MRRPEQDLVSRPRPPADGQRSPQPEQLNRPGTDGRNQLITFAELGLIRRAAKDGKPLPPFDENSAAKERKLAEPADVSQPLEARVRAYLHANCAHCHMKWGGGNAEFQLLATMPLNELGIVGTRPAHGAFEIADARVLSPGHPERSLIAYRMNKLGLGRMPHVASSVVDEKAVRLVEAWIKQLPEEGKRRE